MSKLKKVGRKPWAPTKAQLKQVKTQARLGLTQEQIAASLGISSSTWYQKLGEFPEIMEAFKKGRAQGISTAAAALEQQIEKGNVTAMIFKLKCRGGWNDQQQTDNDMTERTKASGPEISERILTHIRNRFGDKKANDPIPRPSDGKFAS